MAIIRSNGILFVDSIPTHTPTGNQARIAFMQDLSQWWVWNGTVWKEMSISWDILNNSTAILDETVDIQVQVGGIARMWRALGSGADQEYFELGSNGVKISQLSGGISKQIILDGTSIHFFNEHGEYKFGDNAFFPLPTDADADHDLVIDSTTALIGKRVKPKVYKAILSQTGTGNPTATILENTLGEVPTYVRNAEGDYEINTVGNVFTANKTFVLSTLGVNAIAEKHKAGRISNTEIQILTFNQAGNADELEGSVTVLIEVYP